MDELIDLLIKTSKLKKLVRTGWVMNHVENPEHVADHIFRATLFVMLFSKKIKGIDEDKALKMVIIHDLGEVLVGDITPLHDTTREEKTEMEKKAMEKMFAKIEDGNDWIELWKEAEDQKTKEAKLVKDVDHLEMVLQALEYESEQNNNNLDGFWEYVKPKLYLKESKDLYKVLERKRRKK